MNTDWVTVGVRVAGWDYGRDPRGNATITTVKKLTNTEVISATGNRYRRETLHEAGIGRGFLLPLSDARVVNVLAHEQAEMLQMTIDRLLRAWAMTSRTLLRPWTALTGRSPQHEARSNI